MVSIAPFSEPPVPPGGGLHRQGGGDRFAGSPFRIHCADCVVRGLGGSGGGVGEYARETLHTHQPQPVVPVVTIAGDRLTVHRDAFHVRRAVGCQGSPLTVRDRPAPIGLKVSGLKVATGAENSPIFLFSIVTIQ